MNIEDSDSFEEKLCNYNQRRGDEEFFCRWLDGFMNQIITSDKPNCPRPQHKTTQIVLSTSVGKDKDV